MAEVFHVGLTQAGREVSSRGYRRCRLVLTLSADGLYRNELAIEFPPLLKSAGFLDGYALCGSEDGPVIAMSPMLFPMLCGAGKVVRLEPGTIVMDQASLRAIRTRPAISLNA